MARLRIRIFVLYLETWARAFGAIHAFGIEGTGSD
jgi:hypothetical protein